MGLFGGKGKKTPLPAENVQAAEEGVDMTEVMAAVSKLNGKEPPSGPVFVPASTFPVSARIKKEEAEAAAKKAAGPEVGEETAEGIYIGRFKGNDGVEKDWFAAPEDAKDSNGRLALDFNEAAQYAQASRALGHNDWIVPPGSDDRDGKPDILGAMFNSKSIGVFEGTFKQNSSDVADWYWSSPRSKDGDDHAGFRSFSNGDSLFGTLKSNRLSVRLVRSVAI